MRLIPSGRSLLVGFAIVAVVGGAYLGARETAVFAVRDVQVDGAPPELAKRVRTALAPLEGESLVGLSGGELEARLAPIPEVRSATYDRAFPSTLRVFVVTERPVAVLRRGPDAWLVSARGRVLRTLSSKTHAVLPRVWLDRSTAPVVGATLADPSALRAVLALGRTFDADEGFPARVRFVRATDERLTFVLRSGTELRLGDATEMALKLAVARRVLVALEGLGPPAYVDLSVPERPVAAGVNSQVDG